MMTTKKAEDVVAAWETSSHYWNKHQALIEQMFAPLTRALIESAAISAGQKVLDVGGGAGEPSLTIATVVGPTGRVSYSDPAAGMVQSTREESAQRGLTNIEFHQCTAEQLPFENDTFDVAVGRLSAMFFADVAAALREVLRVLKPGGTVAFLVWADRELNPFFSIISDVLNRFVPAEPEDEDAPGAFRFARPGKVAAELRAAGAIEVNEQQVSFDTKAPINPGQFWEMRTEMSDTFRAKLEKLTPEEIAKIRDAVLNAVGGYFTSGQMSFPSQVLIVSARKPDDAPIS